MPKYRVGLFQKEFNMLLFALGHASACPQLDDNLRRSFQELAATVATNSEQVDDDEVRDSREGS